MDSRTEIEKLTARFAKAVTDKDFAAFRNILRGAGSLTSAGRAEGRRERGHPGGPAANDRRRGACS